MGLMITPGGRLYHTGTGRFLSRDPVPTPGKNPYVALGCNPLSHVDPSAEAEQDASSPTTYTVQRGDNAWRIVHRKFPGRGLTTQDLMDANPHIDWKRRGLRPGDKLNIPAAKAKPAKPAPKKPVQPKVATLTITITRDTETCESTTGTFEAKVDVAGVGSLKGYTLECPSKEKRRTPKTPVRIPPGTYGAEIYDRGTKGKKVHRNRVFLLKGVPGRTLIEIHVGNKPADTEGCILPGSGRKKDWVSNSLPTMGELLKLYDEAWRKTRKTPKVRLEIKEAFK